MATSKDLRESSHKLNDLACKYHDGKIGYNEFMQGWHDVREATPHVKAGKVDSVEPVGIAAVAYWVTKEMENPHSTLTKHQATEILDDLEHVKDNTDL